jgi:hypothetical protein
MLVFSTHLCVLYYPLLPLSPSLWFNFPPPPPFPVWISTLYVCTYIVYKGGDMGFCLETIFCRSFKLCIRPDTEPAILLDHPKLKHRRWGGLRQINSCRIFLDGDILHCLLWVLSFYVPNHKLYIAWNETVNCISDFAIFANLQHGDWFFQKE